MGVDTGIYLPSDVRVRDVADVIGILLGCPVVERMVTGMGGGTITEVKGVKVKMTDGGSACAAISIHPPAGVSLVDGEAAHFVLYHFETKTGERFLMPRSKAVWIAVARRLVSFFGGRVDYMDCDDKAVDYRRPKPRRSNSPEGDKPWEEFQAAKWSVRMLDQKEIVKADQWAAYKLDGSR